MQSHLQLHPRVDSTILALRPLSKGKARRET
jgi:hypothetical protein